VDSLYTVVLVYSGINISLTFHDFKSVIDENRILKETRSAITFLQSWCNS
jgi:hypothetical protein